MVKNFQHIAYLEKNGTGKNLLALGCKAEIKLEAVDNAFDKLRTFFLNHSNSWLFGYFTYDLKNGLEKLSSNNKDGVEAPELHFFIPEYLFEYENLSWKQISGIEEIDPEAVLKSLSGNSELNATIPKLLPQITYDDYEKSFKQLQKNIKAGNIYEVNYCFELAAKNVDIDSWSMYKKINGLTQAPQSAYLKMGIIEVMCASPERFIRKEGKEIISQPIKGTIKRGSGIHEDVQLINQLKNDPKEIGENVMITDLVRNDLSRTAAKGSVKVENLFEIQTFKNVHQMVSTVKSELDENFDLFDVLKFSFPMGSMTGAPKISAMNLIEQFENSKRGIYSGSIGFINPTGDCDFNVVIRTLIYNRIRKYLSLMVGSAITAKSTVIQEFEECMLKADALMKAIKND